MSVVSLFIDQHCPIELSVMIEMHSNTVATSPVWLLYPWNVPSVAEELDFHQFELIHLHLTSHV